MDCIVYRGEDGYMISVGTKEECLHVVKELMEDYEVVEPYVEGKTCPFEQGKFYFFITEPTADDSGSFNQKLVYHSGYLKHK